MTELTAREDEVLRLAADGLSNDDIAGRLEISRRTVEAHLRTLFRKTGVSRRSQLSALVAGQAPPGRGDEQSRLDRYDAALRRLVDRHLPLFEERVELTFTVGGDDGGDLVVERRRTVPKPYVVYRAARPIVSSDAAGVDPLELGLVCDVQGQDVRADVVAVTEPDGQPLAVVLFQPGLSTPTDWQLRYGSHGLWDPLREAGADRLTWQTATRERRHRPTITEIVVQVEFPPGWTDLGLAEWNGVGAVSEVLRHPSGLQVVRWHDPDPTAVEYDWRLTGTAPAG